MNDMNKIGSPNSKNSSSRDNRDRNRNRERGEMNEAELIKWVALLLNKQQKESEIAERNERIKKVLTLLASGAMLATVIAMPGTARLLKNFRKKESDWDEWKMFNDAYLRRTIKRLAKEKVVEIQSQGDRGEVILTEKGRRKVLKFGLGALHIDKPEKWDQKWRLVLYDVEHYRKSVREQFRRYLKSAGFYPLQKSVYLHAYPCEDVVEFLRSYLGLSGQVRLLVVDKIEDDQAFRQYFGV